LDGAVDETGERRCFFVGQFHARRVWGTGVSAAADPSKDSVQSGLPLVMRGLLQTMYAYCEGPPSTPLIEAKLGKQLIEYGRVL
jgi:hypothetical protein